MTFRLSTGARNALLGAQGLAGIFQKCKIDIYSGTQPLTADAAATGTLLGTVTLGSGAYTPETQATGTITLTGGTTSVATATVGGLNIIPDGPVLYNTSLAQTASDLCDAINRNGIYTATVSGAVVTLKPRPGVGDGHNAAVVTSTGSVTATYANMSGGVDPVNGLTFAPVAGGVLTKPSSVVWGFLGIAAGTAGWFRVTGSVSDGGGAISGVPYLARMDGSIATSGGEMSLSNIAVAVGAPNTIDQANFTMPAQ